ncbi:cytochrome c [Photobacterium andalusiense]|uniref:Gluconate 2-dehydrogenase cytochrome c subunit n=1 Tax=Photobacterium andalusiense TaxID=2204296 RepID=A0A1Y6MFY5_9GAMM|nr:cytochrome c [Photobacterium andalusiense]SMY35483.1 Gluconate 2-dehydrogenase cytochrome c subunit precursor [Photobacterium andalusiense]
MKPSLKISAVCGLLLSSSAVYAQASSMDTQAQLPQNMAQLIAQGKYLAAAGDCSGCHTIATGQTYGGGRAFETPFGTLYSTNISSDKQHGIGKYSYQQFVDAVRNGVAPKGNLYPAMPYASYHRIDDHDMQALYAYFMHTKPVTQPNRENGIGFPFNIRMGLKIWNLVGFDKATFTPTADKSPLWNRGKYLVQGLGHCGECHTPRNFMMATEQDHALEGAVVNNLNAPNITAKNLTQEHWTFHDLAQFLKTGQSAKGTAFDDMFIVEKHSLTQLNDHDISAITNYLLNQEQPQSSSESQPKMALSAVKKLDTKLPGYRIYMDKCSGCHGISGQGIPNVAPALKNNATIGNSNIFNTVAVLNNGIKRQSYSQEQTYYAMPGYKDSLDDQQMADLITYLHQHFTVHMTTTTAEQVAAIKKQLASH